jgi:hypothetical protein
MRVRSLTFLIPAAIFLVHAAYLWGYTTDDAGISFTYARNLAQGHGLVLNPGEAPVEAYSNPLWTFLLAAAVAVGIGPIGASKTMGILLSLATVLVLPKVSRDLFGDRPSLLWLLAPTALAASTPFVLWTVAGLENSLTGFLLLTALWRNHVEIKTGGPALSGFIFFLLAITRPEGALYFVVPASVRLLLALRTGAWWEFIVWAGTFALPMALYHLWHYLYFGEVVPNTYYAKSRNIGLDQIVTWGSQGWDYLRSWVQDYRAWPLALAIVILLNGRTAVAGALLLGSVVVGLLGVIYVGGDWMQEYRFISPLLPVAYLLVQEALLQSFDWLSRVIPMRIAKGTGIAAGLLLLLVWAEPALTRSPNALAHPLVPLAKVRERALYFRGIAEEVGVFPDATYADVDLGATSYFSGLRMVDLGGLADPVIAKARFDRRVIRQYVLEMRRPTFIHIHGVWLGRLGLVDGPEIERDYLLLDYYVDSEGRNYNFVRRDVFLAQGEPQHTWLLSNGDIAITGYDFKVGGSECILVLYWKALRRTDQDYSLSWSLETSGHRVASGSRGVLYGRFPVKRWKVGEVYRERIGLPPFNGEGSLTLTIVGREAVSGTVSIR